ncbi:21185_t:CDS:1, partial [Racocetra persica]
LPQFVSQPCSRYSANFGAAIRSNYAIIAVMQQIYPLCGFMSRDP